jgi:hypothetical protein
VLGRRRWRVEVDETDAVGEFLRGLMECFGVLMLRMVEIESVLMIGSEDGKVIDIKKVHEFFEFLEEGLHDFMVMGELFFDSFGLDGETFVVVFDLFVALDFGLVFGELYFELDDLFKLFRGFGVGAE